MKIICFIETPKFNSDGTIKKFKKQKGIINTENYIFEPFSIFGHRVYFKTRSNFLRFKLKITAYVNI
jgi:hypothetical protein